MKRSICMILLLAAVTFLTGCWSTTFTYSNKAPGRVEEVGRTFYIFGLIDGNDALRGYELCPEGVQSVQKIHTFGDMLLTCITLSIYSPNTVRVTCVGGGGHNFYLDENDDVVAHQSFDSNGEVIDEAISSDIL